MESWFPRANITDITKNTVKICRLLTGRERRNKAINKIWAVCQDRDTIHQKSNIISFLYGKLSSSKEHTQF